MRTLKKLLHRMFNKEQYLITQCGREIIERNHDRWFSLDLTAKKTIHSMDKEITAIENSWKWW